MVPRPCLRVLVLVYAIVTLGLAIMPWNELSSESVFIIFLNSLRDGPFGSKGTLKKSWVRVVVSCGLMTPVAAGSPLESVYGVIPP